MKNSDSPNWKKATSLGVVLMVSGMTLLSANVTDSQASQYPVADQVAQKVIARYQNSSCADLKAQKAQPPSGQQAATMQKVMTQLRNNPDMRKAFIDQVAGPIANKMFECGMIP